MWILFFSEKVRYVFLCTIVVNNCSPNHVHGYSSCLLWVEEGRLSDLSSLELAVFACSDSDRNHQHKRTHFIGTHNLQRTDHWLLTRKDDKLGD